MALNNKNGILVLDGKGQLPLDCEKLLDKIISPDRIVNFNILDDMPAEVFANTIGKVFGNPNAGQNKFFEDQAKDLIYYGSIFHEAFNKIYPKEYPLNLKKRLEILSLMCRKDAAPLKEGEIAKDSIIEMAMEHPEFSNPHSAIRGALDKYTAIRNQPTDQRGSIFSQAESWISPFMQSKEELRRWVNSETSDIDIKEILRGGKFGIYLPETIYGVGGVAMVQLIKAKVYNMIKTRGDRANDPDLANRSRVFMIIDEAQLVTDEADREILGIARSLDLVCVFATQNIDSFKARIGEVQTTAFIDSFRSIVSYRSSEDTMKFIQSRIGQVRRRITKFGQDSTDRATTNNLFLGNALFDTDNEMKDVFKKYIKSYAGNIDNRDIDRASDSGLSSIFKKNKGTGGGAQQNQNDNEIAEANRVSGFGSGKAVFQTSEEWQPTFGGAELGSLDTAWNAVAVVERGGAPRRDIIRTNPLGNDFKPFLSAKEIEDIPATDDNVKLKSNEELMQKFFN